MIIGSQSLFYRLDRSVRFTVLWTQQDKWEGTDFAVEVGE